MWSVITLFALWTECFSQRELKSFCWTGWFFIYFTCPSNTNHGTSRWMRWLEGRQCRRCARCTKVGARTPKEQIYCHKGILCWPGLTRDSVHLNWESNTVPKEATIWTPLPWIAPAVGTAWLLWFLIRFKIEKTVATPLDKDSRGPALLSAGQTRSAVSWENLIR